MCSPYLVPVKRFSALCTALPDHLLPGHPAKDRPTDRRHPDCAQRRLHDHRHLPERLPALYDVHQNDRVSDRPMIHRPIRDSQDRIRSKLDRLVFVRLHSIEVEQQYFFTYLHSNVYTLGVICGWLVASKKEIKLSVSGQPESINV